MITALYAGLLGLMYLGLTVFVIKGRFKNKLSLGDGGDESMTRRIRSHGNFAEFVPFTVILLFIAEWQGIADPVTHILGLTLVIGRSLHFIALNELAKIPMARQISMVMTLIPITILSIYNIFSVF